MKKLKEKYNWLKEKLSHPKTRAATILCMYAIFFFLVFILINSNRTATHTTNTTDTNNKIQNTKNENVYKLSDEFEYSCTLEYEEDNKMDKYLITGKITNTEKSELVKIYNSETEEYTVIDKPNIVEDRFIFQELVQYVKKLEFEFSTSYKDGSLLKNFQLPLNILDETYPDSKFIDFNIYEKDNKITKIIINPIEYYKLNNDKITNILYTIEYTNL